MIKGKFYFIHRKKPNTLNYKSKTSEKMKGKFINQGYHQQRLPHKVKLALEGRFDDIELEIRKSTGEKSPHFD